MNKRQVFLLFSLLFLVACGQKEGPNSSEAESTTATTSIVTSSQGTNQSELTTESEASSSNPATSRTAHFNGSYYSVQGKYGEVIIVNKNILRLVVKKSPTGESTHYFFHSQDDKVEVSC